MYGCRSSKTCSCKSSNQLRCDQCGKSFQYDPDCVGELGQHSFKNHWVNRIGHFAQANENNSENTVQWISKAKVNVKCLKHEDLNDQYKTTVESWREGPTDLRCCQCGYTGPPYIRRQKNKVIHLPKHRKSYVGDVSECWPRFRKVIWERWKEQWLELGSVKGSLYTSMIKIAYSRFGHYLLMACWPLCFVPISSRNEITLYCRKCGSFFGCYDLDSGTLVSSCYSSHVSIHSNKNCAI